MSVTPSDLDIQRAAMQAELGDVHTAMPAEVLRVHAGEHGRQFVDVQPSLQRRAPNEDGVMVDETLPVVPMVPVGYMQGGGFFISVPLAAGDFVLLVFAERSLDQWLQTARKGSQRAITPGDMGTHTLEGAVALPCGPAPRSALLEGVHAQNLVIGVTGATAAKQIHITPDGAVLIGGDLALEPMVLGTALKTWLSAMTVPTAMGPSGTPINAPNLTTILSELHKLK